MKSAPGVLVHAVGDILLGTDWPDSRIPKRNPLRSVAPLLRRADLTLGNLEGVLADGGTVRPDKADPKRSYAFRMPRRLGPWLTEAGFDALCVANNHAGDFGPAGRRGTRASLDA
ncbi:MAG: CapA family protein, partial [Armatimonadota bacterium]